MRRTVVRFGSGRLISAKPLAPSFSDADRGNLAFLIAAQGARVPGALKDLELQMVISVRPSPQWNSQTSTALRESDARTAPRAAIAGRVTVRPSTEKVLEMVRWAWRTWLSFVYRMAWTLLRSKDGADRFICSDRPLSMVDSTPAGAPGPGWLSSPNVKTFLPLGSTACLRISPGDPDRLAVGVTGR